MPIFPAEKSKFKKQERPNNAAETVLPYEKGRMAATGFI
jgi:hypothetical protein